MSYLMIKALHLIAVIAWSLGAIYLPRVFAQHYALAEKSEASTILQGMERRLLIMMAPAALLTWVLGFWLARITEAFVSGWFHSKIMLVILLTVMYAWLGIVYTRFARGERPHGPVLFRCVHIFSALLIIGAIFLVVLKPF